MSKCPNCGEETIQHGTHSRYAMGCRCEKCIEKRKLDMRKYRAKRARQSAKGRAE